MTAPDFDRTSQTIAALALIQGAIELVERLGNYSGELDQLLRVKWSIARGEDKAAQAPRELR